MTVMGKSVQESSLPDTGHAAPLLGRNSSLLLSLREHDRHDRRHGQAGRGLRVSAAWGRPASGVRETARPHALGSSPLHVGPTPC